MTLPIHTDLLTTQKKTAYQPSIQITFADNNLPHPLIWDTSLTNYSANPTSSCRTTNYIIRAHRVSGVGVQTQRISNPTQLSQWEATWTTVDSNGIYPTLFWTGSRVVLVYQDASTKAVKFRTSSDEGASWSAATTIWTPTFWFNNLHFGVSGGTDRSGFFYAETTNLHFCPYNHTSNSFPSDYSLSAGATLSTSHGIHISGNNYLIALNLTGYTTWANSTILLRPLTWTGTGSPTWGTATPYNGIHGGTGANPAYSFNYLHLAKIGDWYYLTYTYNASAANGAIYDNADTIIATSNDGAYFTAGLRLGHTIADRLQTIQWTTGGPTYLFCDTKIWTSTPTTTITVPHTHIKALDIQDNGPIAHAEITLDNRTGAYTSLPTNRLGCNVTIERGALINGTPRRVARETFVAYRFTRQDIGNTITIHAFNYYRLLELWRAEIPYYWSSIRLDKLIESIAALAGIHSASFDSSPIWSTTIGQFFINPGQTAAEALASLQDQFQFVTRMASSQTIHAMVISQSPTPTYTFGTATGQHPTIQIEDDADRIAPPITHAEVIGSNAGGQAIATDLQAELGRQFTHRIERQMLTTNADCTTAATAIITKATTATNRARITCLPAFHLQPYDTIASSDWQPNTTRYITALRETYNPLRDAEHQLGKLRRDQNYRQTITLATLTRTAAGDIGPEPDTIVPDNLRRSDFRKGLLISFDTTTWTALVRFADSAGAVHIPVARHIHPNTMIAGRRVAVLLFDITNPTDGLVIGTYTGTTNLWQPFDRLIAADGSPSPAAYADADGRLKAPYGLDVTGTLTATSHIQTTAGYIAPVYGGGFRTRYITLTDNQTTVVDDLGSRACGITIIVCPNHDSLVLVGHLTAGGTSILTGINHAWYTTTKDTTGKINIYKDTANNNKLTIQNKTGTTVYITAFIMTAY